MTGRSGSDPIAEYRRKWPRRRRIWTMYVYLRTAEYPNPRWYSIREAFRWGWSPNV